MESKDSSPPERTVTIDNLAPEQATALVDASLKSLINNKAIWGINAPYLLDNPPSELQELSTIFSQITVKKASLENTEPTPPNSQKAAQERAKAWLNYFGEKLANYFQNEEEKLTPEEQIELWKNKVAELLSKKTALKKSDKEKVQRSADTVRTIFKNLVGLARKGTIPSIKIYKPNPPEGWELEFDKPQLPPKTS